MKTYRLYHYQHKLSKNNKQQSILIVTTNFPNDHFTKQIPAHSLFIEKRDGVQKNSLG